MTKDKVRTNPSIRFSLYQNFPPIPDSDLSIWKNLDIDKIEEEEVNFLFATSSMQTRSRQINSKRGHYFFQIDLWTQKKDTEELQDTHKAIIDYMPFGYVKYYMRFNIIHPDFKAQNDPAKSLIKHQYENDKTYFNRIAPEHIDPMVIEHLKREIVEHFNNFQTLQLDRDKPGKKRAYFHSSYGRFYVGIAKKGHQFP